MLNLIFSVYEENFDCYLDDMGRIHPKASPYKGFRIIGPQRQIIYARSLWEANFSRYLQYLQDRGEIKYWRHEPRVFQFEEVKRGINNYTPDFFVCINDIDDGYYVEVKGWMDRQSITKINRFKKYYPEEELRIIDKKWFKDNSKKLQCLIPEWETETKTSIIPTEEAKKLRNKKKSAT